MKEADIVIVGGGPIGYAQAMAFKKLNKDLKVVVLEKYPEFERKHTLVMQPKQLEKLMIATGAQNDPDLKKLLKALRKKPHIRTNHIQEQFKKIAEAAGVETVITTVEEKNKEGIPVPEKTIDQLVLGYKPKLIVGADGTHSVVNEKLFPKGNHEHTEVDFAMQIRYEIEGNADTEKSWEKSVSFYQNLARQGLVATQQIGKKDPETGKTPITVQLIIPKEDYLPLKQFTAKKAIKPFANDTEKDERERFAKVPPHLRNFISNHIESVLMGPENGKLDKDSIRISVNELPASKAKKVVTEYKGADDSLEEPVQISLNGDAALGLSYFKGFNAGLEALAKYVELLKPALVGDLDKKLLKEKLEDYQNWFSLFADKKIDEVKEYSALKIKPAFKIVKFVRKMKDFSHFEPPAQKEQAIQSYFRLLTKTHPRDKIRYEPYPHRAYNPDIKLGQFAYVPIRYSLRKMGKLFIDFFKPYKGTYQLANDFKQPLVGTVNITSGLVKIVTGIVKPSRFADGLFTLARGLLELALWPLAWTLKPLLRGLITLIDNKPHLIEKNHGMEKLAARGEELLQEEIEETFSFVKAKLLLGICHDLHRKFDKANQRHQKTGLHSEKEEEIYATLIPKTQEEGTISFKAAQQYIGLFVGKKLTEENLSSSNEEASGIDNVF